MSNSSRAPQSFTHSWAGQAAHFQGWTRRQGQGRGAQGHGQELQGTSGSQAPDTGERGGSCVFAQPKRGRRRSHPTETKWHHYQKRLQEPGGVTSTTNLGTSFDFPHQARPSHHQPSPVLFPTPHGCSIPLLLQTPCYLSPYLLLYIFEIRESRCF